MRLTLEEKKYLLKILNQLTDDAGYFEVTPFEREHLALPLYLKFKKELTGV